MAIPLYDNQPTRRVPLVTYALIAVNFVVFLLTPMAVFGNDSTGARELGCAQSVFVHQYGAIPRELTSDEALPLPAEIAAECGDVTYAKTPLLSAFSSMFLHSGWLHLLGNMLYLFVFGQATEDRLGRFRFLLFYLVCGLAAAYGYAVTHPGSETPLVGASGAVAGVLGSHLVLHPRSRTIALVSGFLPFRLPAWVLLGQFFVLQWLSLGSADGVAYVAHIYGFAAGALLGLLARTPHAQARSSALS
ncbi:rhomboid family intramembrane serine protease [Actinocorallia sp. API 0066]|uniref:rhomboid family intramembrane serine protease n=1 Tax=Actinocorallia sp. API 0066 TaxID=2896846 RepID=UPI001E52A661|nr:rhomboid family intramembrane serine protease [Actinocorallia sp. API 0066]MCD0450988.1 rhomboid family intramembrane serine protease [Actinocorallia sp. API 0066]